MFIVFFEQGYKPEHIELEPKWKVGHGASGRRADIMIKDNSGKHIGAIEMRNGIWGVFYRNLFLGYFNENELRTKEQSKRLKANFV